MSTPKKKPSTQKIRKKEESPNVAVETPKTAATTPIPNDIRLKQEFDAVALWMSLPRKEREPETQLELAKELGISEFSITDWRKRDDFWDLVDSHRQRWVKDDISDVVAGLIKRAKHGSAQEVKLFLQFANAFTEKVEHSGLSTVNIQYVQPADKPTEHSNPADTETAPSVADTPRQDDN